MPLLLHDLRFALRTLRNSPLFSLVALASLALGIGANTAVFTLVHQLILQPLGVRNPDELVSLAGRGHHYGGSNGPNKLSFPMYRDIRYGNHVFSGVFCSYENAISVTGAGRAEIVSVEFVSGNYFSVLGIRAAAGRVFSAADDSYPGGRPFAVLSYGYWKTRFNGDLGVIGRKIVANGYPLTIIGVSQAGFEGIRPGFSTQIRIPITMYDEMPRTSFPRLNNRRLRWVDVFGRLKPGVTRQQAEASLQPLFHQILLQEVQQEAFARASAEARQEFLRMWLEAAPASRGHSDLRDQFSKPLLALMAIVALVLLIACSNVANLLIARAHARRKEMAVRLAIGAGRLRLVRLLLVESVVLSAAGGLAGVAMAILMDRGLLTFVPEARFGALSLSNTPDWTVLGFAFLLSMLAAILFGLAPALRSTRLQVADTLKDQAGAVLGGGSVGLRKALIVGQVSLSLLLLVGAGLFLRTLSNLRGVSPGFDTANLLSFTVEPTMRRYEPAAARDYYRRLDARLQSMPGIESIGWAMVPLLQNYEWTSHVAVEGYTPKPGELPAAHVQYCGPRFFRTLKIPLLAGREFTSRDVAGAPRVGIVNRKFARRYFGSANAVGRHVGRGIDPGTKLDIEIVGVVGDVKYADLRDAVPEELYTPWEQADFVIGMTAYVRACGNPAALFNSLRAAAREVDSEAPMHDLFTVHDEIEMSLLTERLLSTLSAVFGALASLLAAVGLYGVMAFTIARRTREIGIRMALGAGRASVVWMVMREVLVLTGAGAAFGILLAWAATRLLKAQLYGVSSTDLLTIALATLGIALVAIAAGYLPARRATAIDPVSALHSE